VGLLGLYQEHNGNLANEKKLKTPEKFKKLENLLDKYDSVVGQSKIHQQAKELFGGPGIAGQIICFDEYSFICVKPNEFVKVKDVEV